MFMHMGTAPQAEQVKVIALKVRDKFYREPQSESAMWARKHSPDLGAPLPGLGQQTLPATMPSIDFRLVWHTGEARSNLSGTATVESFAPLGLSSGAF